MIDEFERHAAEVKFYQCTMLPWDEQEQLFKEAVAQLCNDYCSKRPKDCCLSNWDNITYFHSGLIVVSPDYPAIQYMMLKIRFVVLTPPNANLTNEKRCNFFPRAIDSSILQEIIEQGYMELNLALGWQVIVKEKKERFQAIMDMILMPFLLVMMVMLRFIANCLEKLKQNQEQRDYRRRHLLKVIAQKAAKHAIFEKEKEREEIKVKAEQRRKEKEEEREQEINEHKEIDTQVHKKTTETIVEADVEQSQLQSISKSPVPSLPPIEDSSHRAPSAENFQTILPILTTQTSEELRKFKSKQKRLKRNSIAHSDESDSLKNDGQSKMTENVEMKIMNSEENEMMENDEM